MHQFRIEARAGEEGHPTPEGMHRDGVDWVLVLMVRRENVASGETTIYDLVKRPLGSFTLTAPLDSALVDDSRVYHGVTPVVPLDPAAAGLSRRPGGHLPPRIAGRRSDSARGRRLSFRRRSHPSREDLAMLDLHFWPTPNGKKVTILLEELGLDYNLVPCNIGRGDQFKPEFLKINPNHRMPVLVDHDPKGGGAPISIFESGAIMMYLAEKEGRFFPQDMRGKYEVTQWVIWQMANQGPKLGECGHFRRAGPDAGDLTYAIRRFTDEANRLYGV